MQARTESFMIMRLSFQLFNSAVRSMVFCGCELHTRSATKAITQESDRHWSCQCNGPRRTWGQPEITRHLHILAFIILGLFFNAVPLHAQTAHFSGAQITLANTGFDSSSQIAVDGSENIFFVEATNNAVKEILAAGGYTTINTLGGGFTTPQGVAVDGSGNVFVADIFGQVYEILAAGGYTRSIRWAVVSAFPTVLRWTRMGTSSLPTPATMR